jgi:hypothetical protein
MITTGKKAALWLGIAGVTLVVASLQRIELMSTLSAHWRTLLMAALFAPFVWIIHHLAVWMKHRQSWDELSAWTGEEFALEQERKLQRSQIIISIGGLYFLALAALWIFSNAV